MGIKSTSYITRQAAIDRIVSMSALIKDKDYLGIESATSEEGYGMSFKEVVDNSILPDISNIENWTNRMLEDCMDWPLFRYSMFDNYLICSDEK